MILRFRTLTPSNSGAPDYNICGQAASAINYTNLSLQVIVDGTTIWNTSNVAAYVFPVAPVTTTNGYVVTPAGKLNTDFYTLQIDTPNGAIQDSIPVQIIVGKSGYIGYDEIFELFNYDLGNNPNVTNGNGDPVDYNRPFDIYLIDETNNVVSGLQTKAYSSIITFQKPFSNKIYVYKADGCSGNVEWRDSSGNLLVDGRKGFYCTTDTTSTVVNQLTRIYDNGSLISICSLDNTILLAKYIPSFNTSIGCNDCCADCCISEENNLQVQTNIGFEDNAGIFQNDDEVLPITMVDIIYEIITSTGIVVTTQTIHIDNPTIPFDPLQTLWENFPLPPAGDYVIKTTIQGWTGNPDDDATWTKVYECYAPYKVSVCGWSEIEQTSCNTYNVHNRSFDTITLVISKLNGEGTFDVISTTEIPATDLAEVAIDDDGVYQFTISREGFDDRIYVVIVYCVLKDCLLRFIKELMCCNPKDKCKDNKWGEFNAIVIQSVFYFGLLQNEYGFNFVYTALSPDKMSELFDIKQVMERIVAYCTDCEKNCDDCAKTNCEGCS